MTECVFVPANEPWSCNVHDGIRTSLDEPQCDIARHAEPLNDAYLDNIRQAIAAGRNPSSRYTTRRLLATIDSLRASVPVAVTPDLRAALEHLDFLSDRHYHEVYEDGSDGADHIEPIRAALAGATSSPALDELIADGRKWQEAEAEGHVVTFSETGYGLMHPPSCRPDLIGCWFNAYLASRGYPEEEPGRYTMTRHKGHAEYARLATPPTDDTP
jgi:hypothetical protein